MSTSIEKATIRKEKLALRKALDTKKRVAADHAITMNLESIPELKNFDMVVSFVSDGTEPNLIEVMTNILESGRSLALPRYLDMNRYELAKVTPFEPMSYGKWGIPEPPPHAQVCTDEELANSLWFIPGVAFDERCARLGRGKGIYDRLLSNGAGFTIGVFYDCQCCNAVPIDTHDIALDMIVTETRILRNNTNNSLTRR